MRRFLCLAAAAFLLCSLTIPFLAGQASAASDSSPVVYFPLHFDIYQYGTGASAQTRAWEGNTFPLNERPIESHEEHFWLEQWVVDGSQANMVYHGAFNFTLHAYDQVVLMSSLEDLVVLFGEAGDFRYVIDINFDLQSIRLVNGEYAPSTRHISAQEASDLGDIYRLGDRLRYLIEPYTNDEVVRISNLYITFTVLEGPPDADQTEIWFQGNARASSPASGFNAWFIFQDLPFEEVKQVVVVEDPTDGHWFDWLMNALSAFFNTPIFGDFSIGGLVEVILAIGLVVLLAKILG